MNPNVHPFFHEDSSTWTYVVVEPEGAHAAIIDPVLDFDPKAGRTSTTSARALLDFITAHQLKIEWIIETHAHADHLSAGHWLKRHLPEARLAIGDGIRKVQKTFRPIFNLGEHFPVDGSQFDHLFGDTETYRIGKMQGRVIPVPGHTNDSVAHLIGDALFTGDSLFMPDGGTARCDFPGGDAGRLYDSIQRLFELPDDTRVFVCHDYAPGGREHRCESTIAQQKAANIHVHEGTTRDTFIRIARNAMPRSTCRC